MKWGGKFCQRSGRESIEKIHSGCKAVIPKLIVRAF
jgi:hypothetical protein